MISESLKTAEMSQTFVFSFIAIMWIFFIVLWSLFIYWQEKDKKLDFWFGIKKIKEFQKLKSILHILMPAFVRERIRQG